MAQLRRIARAAGPDTLLVIGAHTTRHPALLIPAYDDRMGVTAAFNRNLLRRINRELDANFSLDAFRHEARFDAQQQRVEMHLVANAGWTGSHASRSMCWRAPSTRCEQNVKLR